MKPIRYFSMFSGIGGFEVGLMNSKYEFECIGFSEIDKYAKTIYLRHFPNHRDYGDATKINTQDLSDFELLVGGFPCQAFSIAGKRGGFEDIRGTLFFELARVLRDKQPRYFLFENVRGLLSHEGGETFARILETLDECGYNVSWEIYNSKDYDVPQNRERIFIKGYLRGTSGGKILFKPRIGTEVNDDRKVSGKWYGTHRTGRIHNTGGILNCLSTTGQNGGRSQLIQINNKKSQDDRVYSVDGIGKALCAGSGAAFIGLYQINKGGDEQTVNELTANKSSAQRVYDADGLATTLKANGGGQGGKTGLYKVDKCWGSTAPHASVTDGSYTPTLCANNIGTSTPVIKETKIKKVM